MRFVCVIVQFCNVSYHFDHHGCTWNKYRADHLSGKPVNIKEFDSCQGNFGDFTKNQGNVGGKSCQGKVA